MASPSCLSALVCHSAYRFSYRREVVRSNTHQTFQTCWAKLQTSRRCRPWTLRQPSISPQHRPQVPSRHCSWYCRLVRWPAQRVSRSVHSLILLRFLLAMCFALQAGQFFRYLSLASTSSMFFLVRLMLQSCVLASYGSMLLL